MDMSDIALPDIVVELSALAGAQWYLYRTTSNTAYLDAAISTTKTAVDVASSDLGPSDARLLFHLGVRLKTRFGLNNVLDDLNGAIAGFQRAVELTPDDHPDKPLLLNNLGTSFLARFDRIGALDDLEQAISMHRRAVDLTPDDHPDKPSRYGNLGNSFLTRFERTGALEDLEQATSMHQRAVELTPDDHPDKPLLLNDLGNSFLARFDRIGALEDLEQAISMHRRAVDLTPDDHPDKPSRYSNLGNSSGTRFRRTGALEDLEWAISLHRHAVDLTPDGHPDKAAQFNNLGISFLARFDRIGALEDLKQAISTHRRAVDLTPDGHPDKPSRYSNLGNSFLARFERTEELEDLEQAISMHQRAVELTPDDHPDKPLLLDDLGNSFLARFDRIGALEDLEQAISMHRRAVELTPDGHPEKSLLFHNIGNSFSMRFLRTGELQDIEQGISMHRRALELTPDDHPHKSMRFNNLGQSLVMRFRRIGELQDVEQAILLHQRAVEHTPDDHPDKPSRFYSLGNSFLERFERLRRLEDIEQAISVHRRAVELMPDGHPDKPSYFYSLGRSVLTRFEHAGELNDLKQAISYFQRASKLCPTGHPLLFVYGIGLAAGLQCRFEHSGDIDDIREAISLLQQAAELLPDDDPWFSSLSWNLSSAHWLLFMRTQTQMDFDAIVQSSIKSTLHPSGSPDIRFRSARRCARMLSGHPSFSTTDSLLSAHSRVIALLPEMVWFGHGIHRRYEESSQLGKDVYAAVSDAIAAGALTQAVEWLEAGRALIWAQVLSLRTPLAELRASRPDLADRLQSVQARLQSSAYSAFAPDSDTFGGVVGLTVDSAADGHRQTVIEYDKLMKDIRAYPGFEDFLRPKTIKSLIPPPEHMRGPIVFINVHSSRSDAIVVHVGGEITTVPLPELSLRRANQLRLLWGKGLAGYRVPATQVHEPSEEDCQRLELVPDFALALTRHTSRVDDDGDLFVRVAECIWTWIVEPILQSLDLANLTHDFLPHITWCPTGPLTQLPLHAAGIYSDPLGPRTFDFVISSYTPSLSAFLRCAEGVANLQRPTPSILVVTQPATPGLSTLPATLTEGLRLQHVIDEAYIASDMMNHDNATIASVRATMNQHSWLHLACHGSQNRADTTKSAFHLFDGSLTLADLMATTADNAELAFLSACQTAVGDEKTPEESAHLAAGMLAVGFKGVVATMWSIQDADAPIIVEAYYKELLALRRARTLGRVETGAAYALHEATRVLREKVGENDFMRWVPFVHFGV